MYNGIIDPIDKTVISRNGLKASGTTHNETPCEKRVAIAAPEIPNLGIKIQFAKMLIIILSVVPTKR